MAAGRAVVRKKKNQGLARGRLDSKRRPPTPAHGARGSDLHTVAVGGCGRAPSMMSALAVVSAGPTTPPPQLGTNTAGVLPPPSPPLGLPAAFAAPASNHSLEAAFGGAGPALRCSFHFHTDISRLCARFQNASPWPRPRVGHGPEAGRGP